MKKFEITLHTMKLLLFLCGLLGGFALQAMEQEFICEDEKESKISKKVKNSAFEKTTILDVFNARTWHWKKDSSGELVVAPFNRKNIHDSEYVFNARQIAKLPSDIQRLICREIRRRYPQAFDLHIAQELSNNWFNWGKSKPILIFKTRPNLLSAAWYNDDDSEIISWSNYRLERYDVLKGQLKEEIDPYYGPIYFKDYNSDAIQFFSSKEVPGWKFVPFHFKKPNVSNQSFCVRFDSLKERIITIANLLENYTSEVISWDAQTHKKLKTFWKQNECVKWADVDPANQKMITVSNDSSRIGKIRVWNMEGELIIELGEHSGIVPFVEFSKDGKYFITASHDTTAKVWSAENYDCIHTFKGHTKGVNYATFNDPATYAATASRDETAKVWSMKTGECLYTLKSGDIVCTVNFNHAGDRLITALSNGAVYAWNLDELLETPELPEDLTLEQLLFVLLLYSQKKEDVIKLSKIDKRLKESELRSILHSFDVPVQNALIKKYGITKTSASKEAELLSMVHNV